MSRLYRVYPIKMGICQTCGGDIMAKNHSFYKPNRKFCSVPCRVRHTNLHNNPAKREDVKKKIAANTSKSLKGYKHSLETCEKRSKRFSGENSHFWKGGLTKQQKLVRTSAAYKRWRTAVYERDNYTCVFCGARSSKGNKVVLNADHILPFSTHPELRLEVSNGRTLCVPCHKTTDSFPKSLI